MLRNRTGQQEQGEKEIKKRRCFLQKETFERANLIQTPEQTSDLVSSVPDRVGKSLWLMSNFLIVEC